MLTTLASVRSFMQYQALDASDNAFLSALIPAVDGFIKAWLGSNIERVGACIPPLQGAAVATAGGTLLAAQPYYWIITAVNPNGETTPSNEVTVTPSGGNLSATLAWSAVASATGYNVYRGTSAGQENALVATLSPLIFSFIDTGVPGNSEVPPGTNTAVAGLTEYLNGTNTNEILLSETPIVVSDLAAVYFDQTGAWGQGPSAFASTTALVAGTDYALKVDQRDGVTSKSGILTRLNGVWPGIGARTPGRLAIPIEQGRGNLKIVYNGGYRAVPAQIANEANKMIAKLMALDSGFITTSESFEDRTTAIDLGPWSNLLLTPEVVSVLYSFKKLRG